MRFKLKTAPQIGEVEVYSNWRDLQDLYVAALYEELYPKGIPAQSIVNEKGEWELRHFSYGMEDVYVYREASEKEKKIKEALDAVKEANKKLNNLIFDFCQEQRAKEN